MNMNFFRVIKEFYTGNNAFQGRMTRSEYWWWQLWYFVFSFVFGMIYGTVQIILYGDVILYTWLDLAITVFLFFPAISNNIKRMHDIGYSGWWILVPFANFIMTLFPSDGPNQYDLNNKQPERDQGKRRTGRNNPTIERHRNRIEGSGNVNKYKDAKRNY